MKSSYPIVCAFLSLFTSISVFAQTSATTGQEVGKIKGIYAVTQTNMTFNKEASAYTLKSLSTRIIGKTSGTGFFLTLKKPIDRITTNVLGIDKKGVARVSVKKSGSGLSLDVTLSVSDKVENRQVHGSINFEVPLSFESGTPGDFQAGKKVVLVPTAEGISVFNSSLSDLMAQIFDSGLVGGFQNMNGSATINSVNLHPGLKVIVDQNSVTIPAMTTDYNVTIRVHQAAE